MLFARPFSALTGTKCIVIVTEKVARDVNCLNRSLLFLNGFTIQPELLDGAQQLCAMLSRKCRLFPYQSRSLYIFRPCSSIRKQFRYKFCSDIYPSPPPIKREKSLAGEASELSVSVLALPDTLLSAPASKMI